MREHILHDDDPVGPALLPVVPLVIQVHDESDQEGSEDGCDVHPAFFLQEFLETIHFWSSY